MNTISARRVAGFISLAVAIIVGTLGFGFAVSSYQPAAEPSATVSVTLTPSGALPPVASDVPPAGGTIPPFVPIPSGPNP